MAILTSGILLIGKYSGIPNLKYYILGANAVRTASKKLKPKAAEYVDATIISGLSSFGASFSGTTPDKLADTFFNSKFAVEYAKFKIAPYKKNIVTAKKAITECGIKTVTGFFTGLPYDVISSSTDLLLQRKDIIKNYVKDSLKSSIKTFKKSIK